MTPFKQNDLTKIIPKHINWLKGAVSHMQKQEKGYWDLSHIARKLESPCLSFLALYWLNTLLGQKEGRIVFQPPLTTSEAENLLGTSKKEGMAT